MPVNPTGETVGELCLRCGLCCNGVLFADVRLKAGDGPERLRHAGINVRKQGKSCRFPQPCAALESDGRCKVYEVRPTMCRQFECGVLGETLAGRMSSAQALGWIRKAKRFASEVERLLVASGNRDAHLPLTHRYQAVMREPIDLADDDEAGDRRGELMMAVHRLMELVRRQFLARPRAPAK
jgi:Fe-S-cluster containining protein